MTQGKNPGLKIGGKKGAKKRTVDPLSRKEWYDFRAPIPFSSKSFGKTLVTKSSGNSKQLPLFSSLYLSLHLILHHHFCNPFGIYSQDIIHSFLVLLGTKYQVKTYFILFIRVTFKGKMGY